MNRDNNYINPANTNVFKLNGNRSQNHETDEHVDFQINQSWTGENYPCINSLNDTFEPTNMEFSTVPDLFSGNQSQSSDNSSKFHFQINQGWTGENYPCINSLNDTFEPTNMEFSTVPHLFSKNQSQLLNTDAYLFENQLGNYENSSSHATGNLNITLPFQYLAFPIEVDRVERTFTDYGGENQAEPNVSNTSQRESSASTESRGAINARNYRRRHKENVLESEMKVKIAQDSNNKLKKKLTTINELKEKLNVYKIELELKKSLQINMNAFR